MVKYKSNAIMTYSLNAYLPLEGFQVVFNGSKGRIQAKALENSYINAGGATAKEGAVKENSIEVYPMFGEPYKVEVERKAGGHGGGDPVLLEDLFGNPPEDKFKRAASHVDGVMSIMTGVAANKSIATGKQIRIEDLIKL